MMYSLASRISCNNGLLAQTHWAYLREYYMISEWLPEKGPEYWKTLSSRPRILELETDIQLLQSKMHGRLRTEMRSAISHHSARREMLRELGQTKAVLKSVLGRMGGRKHQDPLFLGAVRESDTVVDCTPLDVHEALTRHFQE